MTARGHATAAPRLMPSPGQLAKHGGQSAEGCLARHWWIGGCASVMDAVSAGSMRVDALAVEHSTSEWRDRSLYLAAHVGE